MTCPEPNPNPKVELKRGSSVTESLLPWHRLHFPAPFAVGCGQVIEFWPVECGWGWSVPLLILHALSFSFCWLDAEEPRRDSEAQGDGRATRGHENKFLVSTSQKLIRLYVIRNKLHCVKLLRFQAYLLQYLAFLEQNSQCESLVNCWLGSELQEEAGPFYIRARDHWHLICYRQSHINNIFINLNPSSWSSHLLF